MKMPPRLLRQLCHLSGGERCCLKMPPRLLCQLCHLPGGGEVLLENAAPTAVPAVPPAMGREALLENGTPTAVPAVPPAREGEVMLENATPAVPPAMPTAVPPVPVMPVVPSVHPQLLFHITPTLLYLTKIKCDTRIAPSRDEQHFPAFYGMSFRSSETPWTGHAPSHTPVDPDIAAKTSCRN